MNENINGTASSEPSTVELLLELLDWVEGDSEHGDACNDIGDLLLLAESIGWEDPIDGAVFQDDNAKLDTIEITGGEDTHASYFLWGMLGILCRANAAQQAYRRWKETHDASEPPNSERPRPENRPRRKKKKRPKKKPRSKKKAGLKKRRPKKARLKKKARARRRPEKTAHGGLGESKMST